MIVLSKLEDDLTSGKATIFKEDNRFQMKKKGFNPEDGTPVENYVTVFQYEDLVSRIAQAEKDLAGMKKLKECYDEINVEEARIKAEQAKAEADALAAAQSVPEPTP